MLYRQDATGCLAEKVGARGLTASELQALLARARPTLKRLKERRGGGSLPLLQRPLRRDDLAPLAAIADEFRRRFDRVIVLGIGGSSLGGQALYALADQGFGPRPGVPGIHFLENIDPATFEALFAAFDPARTGIIAIQSRAARRLGDLLDAKQRATAATLIARGRPTRIFALARLDEASLGAFLMHFMLETIIAAELFEVNAFDQPAVEEGKVLARRYLSEMKRLTDPAKRPP